MVVARVESDDAKLVSILDDVDQQNENRSKKKMKVKQLDQQPSGSFYPKAKN